MEGDRILRCVLSQVPNKSVVKDVENYLKPAEKLSLKQHDTSFVTKYHAFSIKLLRCSIQGFEKSRKDVIHLLELCKFAVKYVETSCCYFISMKDPGICQFERLTKLLYHFLAYLCKEDDLENFNWFSTKMLHFYNLEKKMQEGILKNDQELVKMYEKIFEMHWKLAGKTSKSNGSCKEVLFFRLQGLCFLLGIDKDSSKFAKYFENVLLNFMQENKNGTTIIDKETSLLLSDIICTLASNLSLHNKEADENEALAVYLVLLSFKFLTIHCNSKECLENIKTTLSNSTQGLNSKLLLLPLIEALETNMFLRGISSGKISKELCKQAKMIKQCLQGFEVIHRDLFKAKVFVVNQKITVIYDIVKELLGFQEKLCWEILISLSTVVISIKKHIEVAYSNLCGGAKNGCAAKSTENTRGILKSLFMQWYTFTCWCLQTLQVWLSKNGKSSTDGKCFCITKSTYKKHDLFQNSCQLLLSSSNALKAMEDWDIDVRETEYNWMGITSYNLGVIAQKDASIKIIIIFFNSCVQNLKTWVRKAQSKDDRLARIQQTNLVMKNKIFVDSLLKSGDKEKAFENIAAFVDFLLSTDFMDIDAETAQELVQDQIVLWTSTKEKVFQEEDEAKARILSKEIDHISNVNLKFLMECEMTVIVSKRSSSCVHSAKALLNFIAEKFDGIDDVIVSWALLEYASLPCEGIDLEERLRIFSEAINLLEQSTQKESILCCSRDILAMAYFHLGCFQLKENILSHNDFEMDSDDGGSYDADNVSEQLCEHEKLLSNKDYMTSFNTAMDIWTLLIEDNVNEKSSSSIKETFKCVEKTAKCLHYIGYIYSLNRQRFNGIHAFHLSTLLVELSSSAEDQSEMKLTASCEIARLLSDVFDLPSAISVLSRCVANDEEETLTNLKVQLAKASILRKAGECQKAVGILTNILTHEKVLQKTPKSFFMRADCMLALALAQEFPGNSSSPIEHPLALAQEALKIFRNLVNLYFCFKEKSSKTESSKAQELIDVSPWMIVCKLLDCLLYIVQRYKMQGCIPEARCHIKEGLLLCERFSLTERRLEFLIEDTEASLLSHEEEKASKCIEEILELIKKMANDGKKQHEIPIFYRHENSCTCEFCSDVFMINVCLKCLVIRRRYAMIASGNVGRNRPKAVSLSVALEGALQRARMSLEDLRAVLKLGRVKRRKKVTFNSHSIVASNAGISEMFDDQDICTLGSGDIAQLVYCDKRMELACIEYKLSPISQRTEVLDNLNAVISEIKMSKTFTIIKHNYKESFAKLIQTKLEALLASEQGSKGVSFAWSLCRNGESQENIRDGLGELEKVTMKVNDASEIVNGSVGVETNRGKRAARGRKAKVTKGRGKKPKGKIEERTVIPAESHEKETIDCSTRKDQVSKDATELCSEALSLLVPTLDCIQMKIFYELQALVTGYLSPIEAAFQEHLSFSRTLHQQLLLRTIKNMRKNMSLSSKCTSGDDETSLLETTASIVCDVNQSFSCQNVGNIREKLIDDLPADWRVCSLRLSNIGTKSLIITRMQANKQPTIMRIPIEEQDEVEKEDSAVGGLVCDLASAFVTDPLEEFQEILEKSLQSLGTEDVKTWWNDRKKLDTRLQRMLDKIENKWLGSWKGVLLGERKDLKEKALIEMLATDFCNEMEKNYSLQLPKDFIMILLDSYESLTKLQLRRAFEQLLGPCFKDAIVELFTENVEKIRKRDCDTEPIRTPCRRWREKKREVNAEQTKRGPVILILDKHLQKIPWESISILRDQQVSRMPSLLLTNLSYLSSKDFIGNGIDTSKTFYVLNPRNDLQNTQKTFETWFQSDQNWTGISGRAPTGTEYKNALESHDMFIYCGHGNGKEFLRGDDIQRINCRALTFLMGCSSGKLQVNGELDARGMALHYLMAGCPAIVANLWDVTDKDIDRFLSKLLKEWLENENTNLTDYISTARDACLLPYLIGASPVIYGLPVITKAK